MITEKIKKIKLVLTDCDGVLTDGGVYYSARGEEMKRFHFHDGMGIRRLREICGLETGIVTGENSGIVTRRAEKLKITEVHLDAQDKVAVVGEILRRRNLDFSEIAFIGDDVNDCEVLKRVGFSAAPANALDSIKKVVDYNCQKSGGNGAFREFAELIIETLSNRL